ncbi:hypothetical protein BDV09DRAFT_179260 [Aspergillus tetrazonus]
MVIVEAVEVRTCRLERRSRNAQRLTGTAVVLNILFHISSVTSSFSPLPVGKALGEGTLDGATNAPAGVGRPHHQS